MFLTLTTLINGQNAHACKDGPFERSQAPGVREFSFQTSSPSPKSGP